MGKFGQHHENENAIFVDSVFVQHQGHLITSWLQTKNKSTVQCLLPTFPLQTHDQQLAHR